jgi:histidine ammonia-lyase
MTQPKPVTIDGHSLTLRQLEAVAREDAPVKLTRSALNRIEDCAKTVHSLLDSDLPVYGVNTGFGLFADRRIAASDAAVLSRNLIISHASGVGKPFTLDVVRAAMLIRANTLAQGHSGVRPQVITTLLDMLSSGVVPVVPSQGSLGSSGDLAPLSHLALVISCDPSDPEAEPSGEAFLGGERLPGAEAMRRSSISRIPLQAKEGLALTNGATFCVALLSLACADTRRLLKTAEIAAAMSLEALLGISSAFDPRLHASRPHPGQSRVAEQIRAHIAGSSLIDSGNHVQDAYSLRCAPQVQGPAWDILDFTETVAQRECNSATDNPLFFNGDAVSGGNFHGEPIGQAADFLKIALSEIGAISERRVFRLTNQHLSRGLPPMLVPDENKAGLQSGLMMLHYTAASLSLEVQALAAPDSVRSLPTSAGQEDMNANAATAARRLAELVVNLRRVLAIELIAASHALDIRRSKIPDTVFGKGTTSAHQTVRSVLPFQTGDHVISPGIAAVEEILRNGDLLNAVDAAVR